MTKTKGKKNKKFLLGLSIILLLISLISMYFRHIDSIRVTHGERPKYCIKYWVDHGNKVIYMGLFYKVIAYSSVSPKEPYKLHQYKKMVPWFSDYKKPLDYKKSKSSNSKEKDKVNNKKKIKTIDDFYNTTLTKDYDIRNLTKDYSTFDAKKDNIFLIYQNNFKNYNTKVFNDFYKKYKAGKNAFLRVGVHTVEGDLILYDILYNKELGGLYLVSDYTRDKFSSPDDRKITLNKYNKLAVEDIKADDKVQEKVLCLYNGDKYEPNMSNNKSITIGRIK